MKDNKIDVEGGAAMAARKDPAHGDLAREINKMCVGITGKLSEETIILLNKKIRSEWSPKSALNCHSFVHVHMIGRI